MHKVTFSRNGRDAETWRLHRAGTAINGVAIPGQSLMSTNVCCSNFFDAGKFTVFARLVRDSPG